MTHPPFEIDIPQSSFDELRERLQRTRWTDEVEGLGWSLGPDTGYMKSLVKYWGRDYDWYAQQQLLNRFPQFRADVAGTAIHYIHVKSSAENATPIILTHGWPDSFYRFHKVIPLLVNPAAGGRLSDVSFDVVVPSIPGFGFSERKALSSSALADLWAQLMSELGYDRFVAAGGDVGSGVTLALARRYADRLIGIHLTDAGYPTGAETGLTEAEQKFAAFIQDWWMRNGAYAMLQMTRPQSIAFALDDSPVGLAAWILNFGSLGAAGDDIESAFGGRDELLTNISIYWLTKTGGSSARTYAVDAQAAWSGEGDVWNATPSDVPTGFALFPREAPTPREWVKRHANLTRFTEMPRGGHFAALEEPELFVEDIREFVAALK